MVHLEQPSNIEDALPQFGPVRDSKRHPVGFLTQSELHTLFRFQDRDNDINDSIHLCLDERSAVCLSVQILQQVQSSLTERETLELRKIVETIE